jgi:flagellin
MFLGRANQGVKDSMQRLSSGFRINSAKDDAAGMQISNQLQAQTRGLGVAIRNANDALSIAQVAEGAMNEQTSILLRMHDLALQSVNGSNGPQQREALDAEVQQLQTELSRIADTTSFGSQKVINGFFGKQAFQIGAQAFETIDVEMVNASAPALGYEYKMANSGSIALTGSDRNLSTSGTSDVRQLVVNVDGNDNVIDMDYSMTASELERKINSIGGLSGASVTQLENTGYLRNDPVAGGTGVQQGHLIMAGTLTGAKLEIHVGDEVYTATLTNNIATDVTDIATALSTDRFKKLGVLAVAAVGKVAAAGNDAIQITTNGSPDIHYKITGNASATGGTLVTSQGGSLAVKTTAILSESDTMAAGLVDLGGYAVKVEGYNHVDDDDTITLSISATVNGTTLTEKSTDLISGTATEQNAAFVATTIATGAANIVGISATAYGEYIHITQTNATDTVNDINISLVSTDSVAATPDDQSSFSLRSGQYLTQVRAGDMITTENAVDVFNNGTMDSFSPAEYVISLSGFSVTDSVQNVSFTQAENKVSQAINFGSQTFLRSVNAVNIATFGAAQHSLFAIEEAMVQIDVARADLGAIQNRVLHSIANNENIRVNVAESNSRIIDLDFAEESTQLAKMQVLQQTGASMLTQANQISQIAIQLVQG